jgi:hypothetical protein
LVVEGGGVVGGETGALLEIFLVLLEVLEWGSCAGGEFFGVCVGVEDFSDEEGEPPRRAQAAAI